VSSIFFVKSTWSELQSGDTRILIQINSPLPLGGEAGEVQRSWREAGEGEPPSQFCTVRSPSPAHFVRDLSPPGER